MPFIEAPLVRCYSPQKQSASSFLGTKTVELAHPDWAVLIMPACRLLSMCPQTTPWHLCLARWGYLRIKWALSFVSTVWCVAEIRFKRPLNKSLNLDDIFLISIFSALTCTMKRFTNVWQFCGCARLFSTLPNWESCCPEAVHCIALTRRNRSDFKLVGLERGTSWSGVARLKSVTLAAAISLRPLLGLQLN